MARSSDRAQCNEAKEAAARDGGVCTGGSNFTRRGIGSEKMNNLNDMMADADDGTVPPR